uniref:Uncharacterized protein n=1 Tax=Strongyloides stercoralis TaxID=6248 RepID=A0AAF5DNV4_STRER
MRHVNRILTYGEGITIRYLKGEMNGIVDTLKREISKRVYTRKYVVNIKANKEKSEIIVVNKINISEINEEEETFAEKNEKAEDSNFFIEDLNYESKNDSRQNFDKNLDVIEKKLKLFRELHDEIGHTHSNARVYDLVKRLQILNVIDYNTTKRNEQHKADWCLKHECFMATRPLQFVKLDVFRTFTFN